MKTMTSTLTEPAGSGFPSEQRPGTGNGIGAEAQIRVVYREGNGEIHLDWPVDRIASAARG